jgi:hypothetical protein
LENSVKPVELLVATTVAVPEAVKVVDGEFSVSVPVVLTVTPVKLVVLLMENLIGVTARLKAVEWERDPLVPVTVIV